MIIELMVDQFHPEGAAFDDKGDRTKKEPQGPGKKKGPKQKGAREDK